MDEAGYLPRLVDTQIDAVAARAPIVILTGPRGAGKTVTMLRRARHALFLGQVEDLDALVDDLAGALQRLPKPLLIDEWHHVPELGKALKAAVMAGAEPGSFLLTSYAEADIGQIRWAKPGLVAHVEMYPMTCREQNGSLAEPSGLQRLFALPQVLPNRSADTGVDDYLAQGIRGGLPAATQERSDRVRLSWLQYYVNRLIDRDIPALGRRPDPYLMYGYLGLLAAHSGEVPPDKMLYEGIRVSRDTQLGYEQLLQQVGVSRPLPARFSTRIYGATVRQRVFMTDSGLALALGRQTREQIKENPAALRRVLETIVAMQVRAEAAAQAPAVALSYARNADATLDVGIVADAGPGGVVGVAVAVDDEQAATARRSLAWLRGKVGERWVAGAILHPGDTIAQLDESIVTLPISALWA